MGPQVCRIRQGRGDKRMDRHSRIMQLYTFVKDRRLPVPVGAILEKLECSRQAFYRIKRDFESDTGGRLVYDPLAHGYLLERGDDFQELPGLWLSPRDILAMLALIGQLERFASTAIEDELAPLRKRLEELLKREKIAVVSLAGRIRLLPTDDRPIAPEVFEHCGRALVEKKRLRITYHSRGRDEVTDRTVSPQRVVCYRDNWYLDAWCHTEKALRIFSLDRIQSATPLEQPSRQVGEKILNKHYADAYGIFAGPATHRAVLRFTPERARWVAAERWHPKQNARFLDDGRYELTVPYGDDRELVLDILRYGPDVEVVSPKSLRKTIKKKLKEALSQYSEAEEGV